MRNFTTAELTYFEAELRKYKSPWITKIVIHSWFLFGRYIILPIFVVLIVLMIIYNSVNEWSQTQDTLWNVMKGIAFVLFGIGGLLLISHLSQGWKVKRAAKKLGLSIEEWNYLVNLFQIKI